MFRIHMFEYAKACIVQRNYAQKKKEPPMTCPNCAKMKAVVDAALKWCALPPLDVYLSKLDKDLLDAVADYKSSPPSSGVCADREVCDANERGCNGDGYDVNGCQMYCYRESTKEVSK